MTGSAEVPYLLAMLRRRLPLIVGGLVLGLLLALLLGLGPKRYEAEAQVLIGSPASGSSDADSLARNVTSQLTVLRSPETAREVASRLGSGTTEEQVASATTIDEVSGADIVLVQAEDASSARAVAIANTYVAVYLEDSKKRAQARLAPDITALDDKLTELNTQIADTNQQLADAVAPYLRRNPPVGVPDPRTVNPEAAARQTLLLNEYSGVLSQRQALEQQQQQGVDSSVLQEAVASDTPVPTSRTRQAGVVLLCLLLSAVAALVLEALSGRAATDQEVEQALGARIAARFRGRRRRSLPFLRRRGSTADEDERLLWLRAETFLPLQGPALVVVTGAAAGTGTTTVALSLAHQFLSSGRTTVLVDTVGGPGSLSAELDGSRGGLPALLRRPLLVDEAVSVAGDGIRVLGHGPGRGPVSREALSTAVAALHEQYQVVIVDTEPSLGSAVTLVWQADAVVLTVDGTRTTTRRLEELGLVLVGMRERLLPVLTRPSRRPRALSGGRSSGDGVERGDAEPALASTGRSTRLD